MQDVAAHAGVSSATVSRALNAPDSVTDDSLRRVQDAIADLGYLRHGAARALASRRSHTIAAIVPALDNPIFAKCIAATQRYLNAEGYRLLLGSSEYDAGREVLALQALIEGGIDGAILVGTAHSRRFYRLLQAKRIPFVNTFAFDPAKPGICVGFDNRKATARLTEHLLGLGHRRFAMIVGITAFNDRAVERLAGVREALARHAIALDEALVVERPYTIADGREAFRAVMARPDRPTAVICGNDVLAIGAVHEALALGLAIPGEVSIAGFDDLEFSASMVPALTTIRISAEAMGEKAAETLLRRISGARDAGPVELPVELIIRATTGPVPGGG